MYITRRRFDPLEYGRLGSFNTASTRDGSRTSCNYTVLRRLGNAPSRENKWVIWAISQSAPNAHCEFTKWCLENFAGTKREREKRKIDPDNMFFTYTLKIWWSAHSCMFFAANRTETLRDTGHLMRLACCAKEPNGHTVDPKNMHAMTVLLGGLMKKARCNKKCTYGQTIICETPQLLHIHVRGLNTRGQNRQ